VSMATLNGKAAVLSNPQKPPAPIVDPSQIHDGLKMFDRFTGWNWVLKDGKWSKPPRDPKTGRAGSSTNPEKWGSFDIAIDAQRVGKIECIGFVLGKADGGICFSGIDLDDCRDPETGELSEPAKAIIATMDTYTEVSPSGTGIKIFCIGSLPEGHKTENRAGTVEIYSSGRYFALTGQRIDGTPKRVEHRQEQLETVWEKYIGSEQRQGLNGAPHNDSEVGIDSSVCLQAMLRHAPSESENDGSKRLLTICCRAVEFNLSARQAIATIREYESQCPFPRTWSDDEILRRIEDAEGRVERGKAIVIANFEMVEEVNEKGDIKKTVIPFSLPDIIADIHRHRDNFPRRIDNVLFIDDPKHGIDWFDRRGSSGLFGWLRQHHDVNWKSGSHLVTRDELFAELERTAKRYDAIELLPHEPPIGGFYYRCNPPVEGDGSHLRALLDRFRPETTIDRDLIQAAMMTALWGGPAGCRPAFVITSEQGRGVGKTKLVESIAYLCGGFLDVSAGEDISTLKQRFLSPEGMTKRLALIDNVKTLRLSWAELESLITTPTISGKRMYVGEGQRPNVITWFVTLNGVSLATDMAQRAVIIRLAKGKNDGPWYENTINYIDQHRDLIIGDIIGALRSERHEIAEYSRWAAWEKDVLCRLPEPEEAQQLVLERQGEANCEMDEAEIIEEYFAEQLVHYGYCPQTAQVRVPVATAAFWFGKAIGDQMKTAAASRRLKQMANEGQLDRIAADPSRAHGRSFIWTGPAADVFHESIKNDLAHRIAEDLGSAGN